MAYTLTFEQPVVLWLLFSLPLLVFTHLYFMHHAKRKAIRFANFQTLERVTGKRILTKNVLLLVARCFVVTCLVLSAAGPTLWHETRENSSDVVLLIDSSASMSTSDMNGPRIDAAKSAAHTFLQQMHTVATLSVVQFSGLAEVVASPTRDKAAIQNAIDSIQVHNIGGTDIAGAVVTASNLLVDSPRGRVIILITDGVASVSLYDENPVEKAIRYAQDKHVVIHTIGVGTHTSDGFIPTVTNAAAQLDEKNLQTIAQSTGGLYAWAQDDAQLRAAYGAIVSDGSTGFTGLSLHYGLLFLALLALFVEWGLINTRYRLLP
jgi:Ca-activated chloride channel family protein